GNSRWPPLKPRKWLCFKARSTLRGPLGQRLEADAFQLLRDVVVNLPRRTGFDAGDLLKKFLFRFALEGTLAREQFIEDDAQAENITAAINSMPFATGLLRRHIGGG